MSTISASTTTTTGFVVTSNTTGTLVFQTGASPTTALTLNSSQSAAFAGDVSTTGTNGFLSTAGGNSTYFYADATGGNITVPGSNAFRIYTASAERMRIDSSGNLLLGTTTQPYSAKIARSDDTNSAVQSMFVRNQNAGSSASCGYFLNSYGNSWGIEMGSTAKNSNALTFTADPLGTPVEKMRLDTSGNLLVGATSQAGGNNTLFVYNTLNSGNAAKIGLMSLGSNSAGSGYPQIGYNFYCTGTTTINYLNSDYSSWIRFAAGKVETFTAASGTGGTATSPTTGPYVAQGGISWTNGSSDVRLKKNFEPSQGLTELLQIEPVKYHFNWDEDESPKRLGFKAQNLLPLIPEMVSEKDELAEDGTNLLTITPDYILPVLVKAIQELKAELDAAKAEIETLKGAA